jgi:hypothetical protein
MHKLFEEKCSDQSEETNADIEYLPKLGFGKEGKVTECITFSINPPLFPKPQLGKVHLIRKVFKQRRIEMKYLDKEEKDLLESYKRGEWTSIKKKEQKNYVKAAKKSISKDKRINIRLTSKDYQGHTG